MKRIEPGDLTDPRVIELVDVHVRTAREATAPGSAHGLDAAGLTQSDVELWTVWDEQELVGIGALKTLSAEHGEIKSMHTAEHARGRGVGQAMLDHLIARAKAEGFNRLSLETGSWDYFEPARAFYRQNGFTECDPFASYKHDPNSVFMNLDLSHH